MLFLHSFSATKQRSSSFSLFSTFSPQPGVKNRKKKQQKKTKKRTRNSGRTSSGRLRRKGVARSGPDGEPLLLEVLLALHGELLAPDVGVESGAFS